MKQTQNSGNLACKFSASSGFARLKNLLNTKRARTITTVFAFLHHLFLYASYRILTSQVSSALQPPTSISPPPPQMSIFSLTSPSFLHPLSKQIMSPSIFRLITPLVLPPIFRALMRLPVQFIPTLVFPIVLLLFPPHSSQLPSLARHGATVLALSPPRLLIQFQKPVPHRKFKILIHPLQLPVPLV